MERKKVLIDIINESKKITEKELKIITNEKEP